MIGADLEVLIRLGWARVGGSPELTLDDIERFAIQSRGQLVNLPAAAPPGMHQQVRFLDAVIVGCKLRRELAPEQVRTTYEGRPS